MNEPNSWRLPSVLHSSLLVSPVEEGGLLLLSELRSYMRFSGTLKNSRTHYQASRAQGIGGVWFLVIGGCAAWVLMSGGGGERNCHLSCQPAFKPTKERVVAAALK